MTARAALLDAGPAAVEQDIAEAYALVRAYDDHMLAAGGDPHAEFAALRRQGAVHSSTPVRILTGADDTGEPTAPAWHVVSFAAAERVLRDEDAFSSSAYDDSMGRLIGRSFLEMDHREHRSWRNVLQGGFSRQAVLAHAEGVRSTAASRLAALTARGGGDLVAEVAFPVALTTIARVTGLPPGTRIGTLYTWAVGLREDPDGRIADAAGELLDTPEAWAPGSLVDLLHRAEDPSIGTGRHLLPALRLLLSTGTEPPFRSLATAMYATLTHPAAAALLRTDPSAVLQECRRWEPPLTWALRRCTTDTTLSGRTIRRGEAVFVNLASANRDETRWSRPHRLDVAREPQADLAMGTGPHTCLGRHLAAVEAREALSELLDAAASAWPPGWTLHTDGPAGRGFRSPARLDVRLAGHGSGGVSARPRTTASHRM
ncbi:cytochrome P450 [Streptomyces sp. NPDC031705]|uniref:cytochrome P450 n=1 Tax=Streptomyces sp. NPDC031705 TaxID=3155729 RepID=UPI0033CE7FBE